MSKVTGWRTHWCRASLKCTSICKEIQPSNKYQHTHHDRSRTPHVSKQCQCHYERKLRAREACCSARLNCPQLITIEKTSKKQFTETPVFSPVSRPWKWHRWPNPAETRPSSSSCIRGKAVRKHKEVGTTRMSNHFARMGVLEQRPQNLTDTANGDRTRLSTLKQRSECRTVGYRTALSDLVHRTILYSCEQPRGPKPRSHFPFSVLHGQLFTV